MRVTRSSAAVRLALVVALSSLLTSTLAFGSGVVVIVGGDADHDTRRKLASAIAQGLDRSPRGVAPDRPRRGRGQRARRLRVARSLEGVRRRVHAVALRGRLACHRAQHRARAHEGDDHRLGAGAGRHHPRDRSGCMRRVHAIEARGRDPGSPGRAPARGGGANDTDHPRRAYPSAGRASGDRWPHRRRE